jgi:hypothetical protein
VHDVDFEETKGSQDENVNHDNVRGTQLSNAMKNMNIGNIRPRQVQDEEDDQVIVIPNSSEDVDVNLKGPNIARGGMNNLLKILQTHKSKTLV